MNYTIAIIGSFRNGHYEEILEVIKCFKDFGLFVLSPKESVIINGGDRFVRFGTDRKDFTSVEIQMVTLEKIINADIVYVYDPEGYVGKTTCYEIGFCLSKKKPVYFFEHPDDLPIPVLDNEQVFKPREFVDFLLANKPMFIKNYDMCLEAERAFCNLFEINKEITTVKSKKLVICGSMMFYDDMLKCKKELENIGINAIIPSEENEAIASFDERQFLEFKKRVSRGYLKKIRDKSTVGVLIYNQEKNGIPNYIGANTLVELAMAFTWNRKIFLFNDIYSPLKDELQAWDCICLNGDLNKLKEVLIEESKSEEDETYSQLSLFDNL